MNTGLPSTGYSAPFIRYTVNEILAIVKELSDLSLPSPLSEDAYCVVGLLVCAHVDDGGAECRLGQQAAHAVDRHVDGARGSAHVQRGQRGLHDDADWGRRGAGEGGGAATSSE